MEIEVVYLAKGTGEAKLAVEVEVLREEAGDASVIIPEVTVLTLTGLTVLVVSLPQWTGLAVLTLGVEVGRGDAGRTLLAIKVRQVGGAIYTLFGGNIVDLSVGAEDTGVLGKVEVLGRIALNAVSLVPIELFWAAASLLHHDHAALAGFTVSIGRVPD